MQYLRVISPLQWTAGLLVGLTLGACGPSSDPEPEPEPEPETGTEDAGEEDPGWHLTLDKESTPWLLSTWGTATDNRYAAGGTLEEGVILHFDGDSWESEPLPEDTALVNWVFGFSEDNIYAVANGGGALHFDGDEWTALQTPTEEDLWGVWGASDDAIWAVGGGGEGDAQATILHFDGEEWTEHTLEVERPGVRAYYKVWGTAEDNVYVVGQNGVVLHYDGDSWTELNVGASGDLIALWGTGPDNILAVGGRNSAIVSHYDGEEWTTKTRSEIPGVNGVWMRQSGVAHLALTQGYLARISLPDLEIEPQPWEDFLDFHAVFGTPDGNLSAVALNPEAFATMDYQGLLVEKNLKTDE